MYILSHPSLKCQRWCFVLVVLTFQLHAFKFVFRSYYLHQLCTSRNALQSALTQTYFICSDGRLYLCVIVCEWHFLVCLVIVIVR